MTEEKLKEILKDLQNWVGEVTNILSETYTESKNELHKTGASLWYTIESFFIEDIEDGEKFLESSQESKETDYT